MPTVAELQRLDALITRLTPLSQVAQGELIRAQAWNDLVGTVIELARAVLADAGEEEVRAHDHPEQVALSWLSPALRTLIERGPLGDPASVARVADLERKLAQAQTRFAGVDETVNEVRNRIAEVATRDLARQTQVTDLRRVVDGIADPRDDLTAMRETLRAVQNDVATALEVGRRLTVDGAPLDVAGLLDRVRAVEAVRDRLLLPNGSLLDASMFEQRVTELTNSMVTEEELETAIKNRRPRLNATERDALREQLISDAQVRFTNALDNRTSELRNELTTRFSDLDAQITRSVNDSVPAVRNQLLAETRVELASAIEASRTQTLAEANRAMADREAAIRADTTTQIDGVRGEIAPAVTAELDRSLTPRLAIVQDSLATVAARTDTLDQRTGALEQSNVTQAQRLDGLESATNSNRTSITEVQTSVKTIDQQTQQSLQTLRTELMAEIETRTRTIALEEVTLATDRLLRELESIITTRVAGATAELTEFVKTATAEVQTRNEALITRRFDQLRAEMPTLVRGEFTEFQPNMNLLINEAVRRRFR